MSPNIDIHKAEQAMYHFEEQGDDGWAFHHHNGN